MRFSSRKHKEMPAESTPQDKKEETLKYMREHLISTGQKDVLGVLDEMYPRTETTVETTDRRSETLAYQTEREARRALLMGPDVAREFMQSDLRKAFGFRGPPTVVAITNEIHPGRVAWAAIPTWEDTEKIEHAMNGNTPGLRTFVVDIDRILPGLWIPLRDFFTANEVRQTSVSIGASESGEWLVWNLSFPPPCRPPVSGDPSAWGHVNR